MNYDAASKIEQLEQRLVRAEARQRRAARALVGLAVLAVLALGWGFAPLASAIASSAPFACDDQRQDWYCFGHGTPRGQEVNSNFELLHRETDQLQHTSDTLADEVTQLHDSTAALSSDVSSRLSSNGGNINGNLSVSGSLSVGAGLPLGVDGGGAWYGYNAETYTSQYVAMTALNRSVCFLVAAGTYFPSNNIAQGHPLCEIQPSGDHWQLAVTSSGGIYQGCKARCLVW